MNVTRIQDGQASRIEPPCEETWPERLKLEWWAAVTAHDTGLSIKVTDAQCWRGGVKQHGYYHLAVGRSSAVPLTFEQAWSFLSGVSTGAGEASRPRPAVAEREP